MTNDSSLSYLGDGVYVRFNESKQIEVWTNNGVTQSSVIYLDPETFANLIRFEKDMRDRIRNQEENPT